MRMTPLDIESHRFGRRLRGYDSQEVDAFLRLLSGDTESLLKENESQREELRRLRQRVHELEANENVLRDTLMSAQSMSEKLRHAAVRESEVLMGEAEVRAEKVLDAAHRRVARLDEDIRHLRGLRIRLAAELRSSIETHLTLVDSLTTDPETGKRREPELGPRSPSPRRALPQARPSGGP